MKMTMATFVAIAFVFVLGGTQSASACAMCFSQPGSDSPLSEGMKWGILSLLAVVVMVLGCFAAFFIYLARRAAAVAAASMQPEPAVSNQKA